MIAVINRKSGIILTITKLEPNYWEALVLVEGKTETACVFPALTGEVKEGEEVILNTTAMDLGLGSGGRHFVMSGKIAAEELRRDQGHIMKLRYSPCQLKVQAAQEQCHPEHFKLAADRDLEGTPVIGCPLHSMLAPCLCGIRAVNPILSVAYVMTDGGGLPLAMSHTVRRLKKEGLLAGTVTGGHAFGGDYEAVNIYDGLLIARHVLQADIIIAGMGPGIVGTGSKWGHSGLETGQIVNAAFTLHGRSYTIPRISLAEKRERHYGISHHTLTALEEVALAPTNLVLPRLEPEVYNYLQSQLGSVIIKKHRVIKGEGEEGISLARKLKIPLQSMGRSYEQDPAFFLAASATGETAAFNWADFNAGGISVNREPGHNHAAVPLM